jgi:alpha-tubulin suppressor-like RCC1 family protein
MDAHLSRGWVKTTSPSTAIVRLPLGLFILSCRLLAWGDNTKGQLGVGHLQESHEP